MIVLNGISFLGVWKFLLLVWTLESGFAFYMLMYPAVLVIMVCTQIFLTSGGVFDKEIPYHPIFLFCAVELLAIAIRTNDNIPVIYLGDCETKLLQSADDTTGVLKALMDVIEGFEKISGLKINISKSECRDIGEAHCRKGDFLGLKWLERLIKCLGVYLTYDYDEFIN